MSRRDVGWFMAMALLTLLVAASAPAFPSQEDQKTGEVGTQSDSAVEMILRQQEQAITGKRFGYEPSSRRDPFESLFAPKIDAGGGKRPPGFRGLTIGELDLDGIIRDDVGGDRAFFTGPDARGYFVRVGAAAYDGTIVAINAKKGTVTFRQKIDDPRQIKPYRDLVRRLVPLDEESSNE